MRPAARDANLSLRHPGAAELVRRTRVGYATGLAGYPPKQSSLSQRSCVMAKKTAKKKAPAKKAAATKAAKKSAAPKKKAAAKDGEAAVAKKVAAKKPAKKRASRAAKEIRLKAFWGVFNQSLKRVALFEFNERKLADKKATDLTKNGKSPHFVQPVKEVIEG